MAPLLLPTALTSESPQSKVKNTLFKGLHRENSELHWQGIILAPIVQGINIKRPREEILRMVKSISWQHVGIVWIWQYYGHLRMLLLLVALFRLMVPMLPG